MTAFPGSPRLLKGGVVVVDPNTSKVLRAIALQYNPDTLTRALEVQSVDAGEGDRSSALRIKGPPVETITLEVEFDATDMLENPEENQAAVEHGIAPRLAALETLIYPDSGSMLEVDSLVDSGTLEIAPMESPLTLFVWSRNRVVPVRLTSFSITEEAFDPNLNPLRAKVSLGFRVLSVSDLGFKHKGGSLYMVYQQRKEELAGKSLGSALDSLGIEDSL